MIQKISCIRKKKQIFLFCFFFLKWIIVKDRKEIINRSNNTIFSIKLFNNNYLKILAKTSFLSLIINIIVDILNNKPIAKSKAIKSKTKKFNNDQNNLITTFIINKTDQQ